MSVQFSSEEEHSETAAKARKRPFMTAAATISHKKNSNFYALPIKPEVTILEQSSSLLGMCR